LEVAYYHSQCARWRNWKARNYNLGDLLVGAGTSLFALPVGTNNYVLTADNSTQIWYYLESYCSYWYYYTKFSYSNSTIF